LFDTQSTNNSQINPNNTDKEVFDLSVKDDAGNQIDSNPGLLLENSDPSVKEYEIEQATKSINIETTFSFQKRYFTPDFKILKPKVNVESWNNEKFVKDDNIKKAVFNIGYQTNENKFTDQILDKENLLKVIRKGSHCKFKTIIDTTKLTSGVKYRIDIALRPSVYINPSNPSTSSTSIYSLPNPNWRLVFVDKLLQEINSNKSNEQINVAHFIYYISKD